jgi:hypothetical protein
MLPVLWSYVRFEALLGAVDVTRMRIGRAANKQSRPMAALEAGASTHQSFGNEVDLIRPG